MPDETKLKDVPSEPIITVWPKGNLTPILSGHEAAETKVQAAETNVQAAETNVQAAVSDASATKLIMQGLYRKFLYFIMSPR